MIKIIIITTIIAITVLLVLFSSIHLIFYLETFYSNKNKKKEKEEGKIEEALIFK
jgi:hypothetical protein